MTGATHKAVGVCVGVVFTYWGIKTYNNPVFAVSTLAAATGAMLPDIDHNSTRLGAKRKLVVDTATKVLSVLLGLVMLYFCVILTMAKAYPQLVGLLLITILPVVALSIIAQIPFVKRAMAFSTKHRGIMHTLAVPLLLTFGYFMVSSEAVSLTLLAMAAGYLSHLLLDCLNKMGCPILWPLIRKNIRLLSIRTGSVWEYAVSYLLIGVVMVCALIFI